MSNKNRVSVQNNKKTRRL